MRCLARLWVMPPFADRLGLSALARARGHGGGGRQAVGGTRRVGRRQRSAEPGPPGFVASARGGARHAVPARAPIARGPGAVWPVPRGGGVGGVALWAVLWLNLSESLLEVAQRHDERFRAIDIVLGQRLIEPV